MLSILLHAIFVISVGYPFKDMFNNLFLLIYCRYFINLRFNDLNVNLCNIPTNQSNLVAKIYITQISNINMFSSATYCIPRNQTWLLRYILHNFLFNNNNVLFCNLTTNQTWLLRYILRKLTI